MAFEIRTNKAMPNRSRRSSLKLQRDSPRARTRPSQKVQILGISQVIDNGITLRRYARAGPKNGGPDYNVAVARLAVPEEAAGQVEVLDILTGDAAVVGVVVLEA